MTVISLGAGVQSSALFLMSCMGELPKADMAIFADTGCEPSAVYTYLSWLEAQGEKYGIPIHRVEAGNLGQDLVDHIDGKRPRASSIPFFLETDRGGMSGRQCTQDYKIAPIRRKIKELRQDKNPVELWIGISVDEIQRMKDSNVKYIYHVWPLIDKRMSRVDCIEWYNYHDFPQPARSACVFCPYRKNPEWARMKQDEPDAFASAVEFDKKIRNQPRIQSKCYLHKALKPLDEIDFDDPAMEGQFDFGFGNECEGMCGI